MDSNTPEEAALEKGFCSEAALPPPARHCCVRGGDTSTSPQLESGGERDTRSLSHSTERSHPGFRAGNGTGLGVRAKLKHDPAWG